MSEDLHDRIDRLTKETFLEISRLVQENKMLQEECRALREQLKYAEQQVYNGTTM